MSGYSGTPLAKKLGIKPGFRIKLKNAPAEYTEWIGPELEETNCSSRLRNDIDLWHLFSCKRKELETTLRSAMNQIKPDGMIWVSWPKKSSGVPSEITEDTIRKVALPMGLVDVKVCAVSDVWSGLKLVIRKELRK